MCGLCVCEGGSGEMRVGGDEGVDYVCVREDQARCEWEREEKGGDEGVSYVCVCEGGSGEM